MMKRILLDTSVYGKLAEEPEVADIVLEKASKEFIIYGTDVIKNELRNTPRNLTHKGKNLRNLLLILYRNLVKKSRHDLQYNKLIETLVKDYMNEYRKQRGHISYKMIKADLVIIAIATIYKLDIVVSDDEKSMLSTAARAAYKIVNKRYGIPDPFLRSYRSFRAELLQSKHHQEERPL